MMIGDNRDASLDARFFGFVPEENIVGSPMFTWMSVEGLFADNSSSYQPEGKRIRWVAAILLLLFFGWDYFAKFFKKKDKENQI